MSRPLCIAHRGYRAIGQDNSLPAIRHALELGCDMVEIDVRRRRDGALVLHHDDGDRAGAALLADALALIAATSGAWANLDVKEPGLAAAIAEQVRAAGLIGRTAVTGCRWGDLLAVRALEPSVRVGITVPPRDLPLPVWLKRFVRSRGRRLWALELPRALERHGLDLATVNHRMVDEHVVAAVHRAGAEIWCWTVDEPAELARVRACGVDGIVSDDPASHGLTRSGAS